MEQPNFEVLLKQAIEQPGILMKAYSYFHNYSTGNQLLALFSCIGRGIEPGPINTFKGWQGLGRQVKKGSKAIALCMPVTCKKDDKKTGEEKAFTLFVFRNNWFVLSQTEGEDFKQATLPAWDKSLALTSLEIAEVPFDLGNGNCQGFARARQVSVSPIAALPWKTLFHELAHVLLGHTTESQMNDEERTPKDIRELEAEATALFCLESLGMPGSEYCRGYIQEWYKGDSIPEKSAKRILACANKFLKAGTTKLETENA